MELIDKSALVSELGDWRDKIKKGIFSIPLMGRDRAYATFEYEILGKVRDYLDTLEVKEVDLDKEFDKYCENLYLIDLENEPYAELFECAKHFFELGLMMKK